MASCWPCQGGDHHTCQCPEQTFGDPTTTGGVICCCAKPRPIVLGKAT